MGKKQIPIEIAEVQGALYQHLCFLHASWGLFCELFAKDKETVDLLNWSAGGFFYFFQKMVVDDVLLSLCRLTDPEQMRKWKNLSLATLVNSVDGSIYPELRNELNQLLQEAITACSFARPLRHKKIAHNDVNANRYGTATIVDLELKQRIENALAAIRNVPDSVEKYFHNSETDYQMLIESDDARLLVHRLKESKKYHALLKEHGSQIRLWLQAEKDRD